MCSIVREHGNQVRAYASAALHLWESGQKKPAAWLLRRQGVALEEWQHLEAREIFIHCLKPIYAYMQKEDEREVRRTVTRATPEIEDSSRCQSP